MHKFAFSFVSPSSSLSIVYCSHRMRAVTYMHALFTFALDFERTDFFHVYVCVFSSVAMHIKPLKHLSNRPVFVIMLLKATSHHAFKPIFTSINNPTFTIFILTHTLFGGYRTETHAISEPLDLRLIYANKFLMPNFTRC